MNIAVGVKKLDDYIKQTTDGSMGYATAVLDPTGYNRSKGSNNEQVEISMQ